MRKNDKVYLDVREPVYIYSDHSTSVLWSKFDTIIYVYHSCCSILTTRDRTYFIVYWIPQCIRWTKTNLMYDSWVNTFLDHTKHLYMKIILKISWYWVMFQHKSLFLQPQKFEHEIQNYLKYIFNSLRLNFR